MAKLILLFGFAIYGLGHADTSLGGCPAVDPLPGFNINRMLGYWYAIQKTDTDSPCLTYNITQNEEHPEQYKITEITQHHTLWSSGLYHEHRVTGDLTVPDPNVPARMALDLPLPDVGSTAFIVFMTDYDNYIAIFTCKKLPLMHVWGAEILSRAPTLDYNFVDKVRTRLSSYNVDTFNLNIINQSKCAPPGRKGSIIQTASNIKTAASNVVSNVGSKISELASDPSKIGNAASNIYNTVGSKISELASDPASKIGDTASNIYGDIESKVSELASDSSTKIGNAASNVYNNVGAKIDELSSEGRARLEEISKSAYAQGNATLDAISKPIADKIGSINNS